jgi:hypothetical protein
VSRGQRRGETSSFLAVRAASGLPRVECIKELQRKQREQWEAEREADRAAGKNVVEPGQFRKFMEDLARKKRMPGVDGRKG